MAVDVKNLNKFYGTQAAVKDLNFSVDKGEIMGFLGPNGAGKSTTMKIATGFIPPSSGSVIIEGLDVSENNMEVKKLVGYLPENNPLYLDMYVREYLGFVGSLHGFKGKNLKNRIEELIELTGLQIESHKKIEMLSKGYKQRVGLAQALIHDPKVLFLDEPTSGLDPNQIVEIRNLISELGREKTVILSSHIMQEVEAICNRALIIHRGQIVADDSIENLKQKKKGQNEFQVEFSGEIDIEVLKKIEGIINVTKSKAGVYVIVADANTDPRSKVFEVASNNSWSVLEIKTLETDLESIFHQLTQN